MIFSPFGATAQFNKALPAAKLATIFSEIKLLTRSTPSSSGPSSPLCALDIHKYYALVAALVAHQQAVLPARWISYAIMAEWSWGHLAPTDAVVLEATANAWHIENGLHSAHDVTFGEDRSRLLPSYAPQALEAWCNPVLTLIRPHQLLGGAIRHIFTIPRENAFTLPLPPPSEHSQALSKKGE